MEFDLINLMPLVQISIAFNFAFVYLENKGNQQPATQNPKEDPAITYKELFTHANKKISEAVQELDHLVKQIQYNYILYIESVKKYQHLFNQSIDTKRYINHKQKIENSKLKIEKCKNTVEKILTKNPVYFEQACLISGLFGILSLLYIGLIEKSVDIEKSFVVFGLEVTFIICYYLYKELRWLIFDVPKDFHKALLRPILLIFICFISSFSIVWINNFTIEKTGIIFHYSNDQFNLIRNILIFLPFISFIVCFTMYFISIIRSYYFTVLHRLKLRILDSSQDKLFRIERMLARNVFIRKEQQDDKI